MIRALRHQIGLAVTLALLAATPVAAASFTLTSPTRGGALPSAVTSVGGIVFDAIGLNGERLVTQLSADALSNQIGEDKGKKGKDKVVRLEIGTQTGLTADVLSELGGGFREVAVRVTLYSEKNDLNKAVLKLNGIDLGSFNDVETIGTDSVGKATGRADKGFSKGHLDTGFFYLDADRDLKKLVTGIAKTGAIGFAVEDKHLYKGRFDFTRGIDGSAFVLGAGRSSARVPAAVPAPTSLVLLATGLVGVVALRHRATA